MIIKEYAIFGIVTSVALLGASWISISRDMVFVAIILLLAAGAILLAALIRSSSLKLLYLSWIEIGTVLARVNTYIVLSLTYYFVITPISLFARMMRRDILARKTFPDALLSTYWEQAAPIETKQHMEDIF
jgi:hypothetical protein